MSLGSPETGTATTLPETGKPLPSVVAGLLVGFNLLGQAVALSGLIFTGALSVGIAVSTTLLIACCIASTAALMRVRGMPQTTVGALQNVPVAALLPAAFLLANGGAGDLSPEASVATMLALLGGSAIALGAAMLVLSALDLGRIVRLMPHPVSAGFLASAGMVLVMAALYRVAEAPEPGLRGLVNIPAERLSAVGLTLALAVAIRLLARWRADLGPILGITLAIAAFYSVLAWQGLSPEDARALGYLPERTTPTQALIWGPSLWSEVSWSFVWAQTPLILAAAMIGVLGCMLNFTGIELALRTDLDTRKALSVTGLSNVGLGLFGGSISYISSVNTVAAASIGARGPLARMVVIALLAVGLVYARQIVTLTPTFAATALLVYIGYSILARWLLAQRRQQTLADWSIAASIVVVTVVFGILPAIALGIVAASLIFAVSYARLPVVTSLKDLNGRRSTVDRGPGQSEVLDREADKVLTLSLRGFVFFGSVEQVLDHVRAALARPNTPQTIILDFRRVSAMDSAALAALQKLEYLAERNAVEIVIAECRPQVAAAMVRIEAVLANRKAVQFAGSADAALEAAEEALLAAHPSCGAEETARGVMEAALKDSSLADRLLALMAREEVPKGAPVITFGERSDDIFIIDAGRLAVMAHLSDGRKIRVRSLRPGAIVGEIASYAGLPRTADVVAETPATVYRVSAAMLDTVLSEEPSLAAAWHKMIAITLSEKIHRTTLMLRESV